MAVHHPTSFYFTFTITFFIIIISCQFANSFSIPGNPFESATKLVFSKFSDVSNSDTYKSTYNLISNAYEDTYNSVSDTLETYNTPGNTFESITQLVSSKFSDVSNSDTYKSTYNLISNTYEDTYNSVSDTLETYKPNIDVISKFYSNIYNTVTGYLFNTIIIIVGILILIALILVPAISVPILKIVTLVIYYLLKFAFVIIVIIVRMLGFGAGGIVKGTCAAMIMASYGGFVTVKSICAICQSIGAKGFKL